MSKYLYLPDDLHTGCDVIDQDHDDLYRLVAMFSEAGNDIGVFKSVFIGIVEYTIYHFDREERGFAASGYPDTAQHVGQHQALKEKATQILEELRGRDEPFDDAKVAEIKDFLRDWLEKHITKSDMAFAPYFAQHPEAVAAMTGMSFADSFAEDDGFGGSDDLLELV
ncbi:MAG: hemerythrin domain-containing protein [Alphaproteobacteria bacterium]|nr:hemerythrin domain-containing protein [Alphaproteobacteria bacterium]